MSEDDAKDQEAQRVEDLKNTIPSSWEYIPGDSGGPQEARGFGNRQRAGG